MLPRIRTGIALLTLATVAAAPLARAQPAAPAGPAHEEDHPTSIPLWAGGPPGFEGRAHEPERVDWRVEPDITFPVTFNIHQPSITPYLPAAEQATGAAVIIAPGGGHSILTTDREGYDLAALLAHRGIAGFVLKYRLARDHAGNSPYKIDDAGADARRAIRLVRSRAGEWNLRPDRIGFLGFSAGGEVALLAATTFDHGQPDASDPVEKVSSRPDFFAPIYPGGLQRTDLRWSAETPPAFLACAWDDKMPADLAKLFITLKAANVRTELHIYSRGGHGFGVRPRPLAVTGWSDRFVDWLRDGGFLSR